MRTFKTKIYVDILISLNLFINYFILLSVSKFLYLKIKRLRLILGALLGAIYSLYILLPEPNSIFSFFIKILMSISIILVSFKFSREMFLKIFACFFLVSIAFSGLTLAMWFIFRPKGMIVNNGVVYFNISPIILICSILASYFLLELINRYLGKHVCSDSFCEIKLLWNNKTAKFEAQLDTGNSLKEPFSNLPVVIVDKEKIKNVLPEEFDLNNYDKIFDNSSTFSMRLIPFSGVSQDGFLFGFKPDDLEIKTQKGNILNKEAYIGVCLEKKLQYALIGPEILNVV